MSSANYNWQLAVHYQAHLLTIDFDEIDASNNFQYEGKHSERYIPIMEI